MSTASPIINPETKSYYSPRQQGAGAINAKKALESELYLTGPSGLAKIHLGDVGNQFTIKAYLHNLSDKEKTLTYYASILTDKTESGRFTLESQELYQTAKTNVKIGPKETIEMTLNVDVSAYDQKLKEVMENGYFLDGFVHVQSQDGEAEKISIPFLGFKGRFADLEALDTPIYHSLSGTFYYSPKEGQDPLDFELDSVQQIKEKYLTGLMTTFTPWSLVEGSKLEGFSTEMASEVDSTDYLGSYAKEGGNTVRRFRLVNGKPILTISPNGDNNMDKVAFRGVFLRNVKDIKAQVFASDNFDHPIWESPVTECARKDVNTSDIKESFMEKTTWDGKDSSGNTVPEGTYIYRFSYTPVAEGAKQQSQDFSILVDLTPAKLPEKAILHLAERRIELVETGDKPTQEIYRDRLYLKYGSEEPNFIAFEKDKNGDYVLPEEIEDELSGEMIPIILENGDNFYFIREDWAGNFSVIKLSQLLKQKPEKNNELIVKPDKEDQSILEEKSQGENQPKQAQLPLINPSFEDKKSPKDSNKEILPRIEVEVSKDNLIEKEKIQELNPAKAKISEDYPSLIEIKEDYLPETAESQNPLTLVGMAMLIGGLLQAVWTLIKKKN
ncbi:Fn3-like domain-containing protein [Streptococcus penaeicida]|uniref:Fn3-like domain-containing protein n=1 Tax=Streptococcus penaeicida TaxID=1765960 RepID=UPI001FE39C23|nr:Fn3-like domain-containing protein [Streptococcus penaeicida]